MTIKYKLQGESMQMVICQLEPGQTVYAEAGKFLWKTANVSMETRLSKPDSDLAGGAPAAPGASGGGGGFLNKALKTAGEMGKRYLAGESLAFQYYRAEGGAGLVGYAGLLPGHIEVLELDGTGGWIAEKDAFMWAEASVNFDIVFSGLKQGWKGGEGFIPEKFTGVGTFAISGAGNFIRLNPAKYGGKLQVDTGCIVAFQDTITYGVERVGALNAQTAMTALFGGEGMSLATLEGDGEVILQSLTYSGMGAALRRHILTGDKSQKESPIGGLLGGN
jgi:uncharacterized protein (AIM24 family)